MRDFSQSSYRFPPKWLLKYCAIITSRFATSSYLPAFAGATVGAVSSYPLRTLVYNAANTNGLIETMRKTHFRDFHHGSGLNLARANSAMLLQASTKQAIAKKYDTKTWRGGALSIGSVAAMGTLIASTIETYLIRFKKDLKRTCPRFTISKNLIICNGGRELNFTPIVYYKNELPTKIYWPLLVIGAYMSGGWMKQGTLLSRADISMSKPGTAPNLNKDGWKLTAEKMMSGKYTHHSCEPIYSNPTTKYQLMRNFSRAVCPWHLFLFRLSMLWVCGEGVRIGELYTKKNQEGWLPTLFIPKQTQQPVNSETKPPSPEQSSPHR